MAFWNKQVFSGEEGSLTHNHGNGSSRRAINMFPGPMDSSVRKPINTAALRYHELLITLEGNCRTGVLKVVNPIKLSRAAMLIFRGRVLGCVYGRKGVAGQYIGNEAHEFVLADLSTPGNLIDTYEISEPLALAASSLFQGEVLSIPTDGDALSRCDFAMGAIMKSKQAGCIVISAAKSERKEMVYLYGGDIIGVLSEQDGWLKPNLGAVLRLIEKSGASSAVSASVLDVTSVAWLESLGAPLSGMRNSYAPGRRDTKGGGGPGLLS